MRAGLSNPGSLKQALTFLASGQVAGPLFELNGLFGHSFFKGAGLLHSFAAISHGAAPRKVTDNSKTGKGKTGSHTG
ncbi:hypothetical protein [Bradyrhizobium sp. WSM2793]|uniref:hypothetical protein n=1 Tax=Bradyrhizobium sp. WSM2793 TaxID=1038866 RepID=UPI0012FBCB8F